MALLVRDISNEKYLLKRCVVIVLHQIIRENMFLSVMILMRMIMIIMIFVTLSG